MLEAGEPGQPAVTQLSEEFKRANLGADFQEWQANSVFHMPTGHGREVVAAAQAHAQAEIVEAAMLASGYVPAAHPSPTSPTYSDSDEGDDDEGDGVGDSSPAPAA